MFQGRKLISTSLLLNGEYKYQQDFSYHFFGFKVTQCQSLAAVHIKHFVIWQLLSVRYIQAKYFFQTIEK